MRVVIAIEKDTIKGINLICDRYYFGLFREIAKNKNEEYLMRDALFDFLHGLEKKQDIKNEN